MISPLAGLAAPLWLAPAPAAGLGGVDARRLRPLAGLLAVGLGDTAASAVGVACGRRRLFSGWAKTWEGTAAGFAVTLGGALAALAVLPHGGGAPGPGDGAAHAGMGLTAMRMLQLAAATAAMALLEAITSQVDNVFVPLFYYCALAAAGF